MVSAQRVSVIQRSHEQTTDAWWTTRALVVCVGAGDARSAYPRATSFGDMSALAHAATFVAAASSRASTPRASGGVSRTAPRRHPRHALAAPPERAGARRAVVARLGDFAEIDADSQDAPGGVAEGRFGPDAILLVGFTPEETRKWRAELDAIEADFVRLVTCTKDMVDGPLGVALETEQEDAAAETSAFGVERMMFFSGMVGGEIMQLVDLFNGLGWPPSIFACAVPNNWDSSIRELIDEIADDHKIMMEREKEKLAEMGISAE